MMYLAQRWFFSGVVFFAALRISAAPVIDPIPIASIPAGKSLTIPVTASSPNGRPLTFTATSTTNRITVEVHTNNPFWKMSVVQLSPSNTPGAFLTLFRGGMAMVTNIGDMTFMLLRDRAPRTIDVIAGLTFAGFYNSNTIFHRIVPGFVIQGGDPNTNGTGGPVFRYNDEFHPRAMFSGHGQLALANSGVDTDGSQFFVTFGPQRFLDFRYTIFGQLLRGFAVLTNIINTPTNGNSRPFADVIITRASLVPDRTDTAITLTGTNFAGVSGTIKVIADDGAGGRTTNSFNATTVSDTNNDPPFFFPQTVTNLVTPVNTRLTNYITVLDLEGTPPVYDVNFQDLASFQNASNSTFSTGSGRLVIIPATNYSGPVTLYADVAADASFTSFDHQFLTFGIGDTVINAWASNFVAWPLVSFTNQLLATFTNGIPNSDVTNFTVNINWGDNSVNPGTISTNAAGRKEVRGAHTYTNAGNYPVHITLQSRLGAAATAIATAFVPPSLSLTRTGLNNSIRWPAWAGDYVLQSQTNFPATNWTTLTNLSFLAGYDNLVTNASVGSNLYFRLKR